MIRTNGTLIALHWTDHQTAIMATRTRRRERERHQQEKQRELKANTQPDADPLPGQRPPPPPRREQYRSPTPLPAPPPVTPSPPRPTLPRASSGSVPSITSFEELAAEFRPDLSGESWDASNEESRSCRGDSSERSINQSAEQSNQSTDQSNQSTEQSTDQSTDQSTNQSTEQSTEQPTEQSNQWPDPNHFFNAPAPAPHPYVSRPAVMMPISDVRGSPHPHPVETPRPRFPPLPATPRAPSDFLAVPSGPSVSGLPQPHQHVMDLPRLSTSAHVVPPTFGAAATQLEHGEHGARAVPPPPVLPWVTPPSAGGQIPPPPSIPRTPVRERTPLFSQSFDRSPDSESETEVRAISGNRATTQLMPPVTPPRRVRSGVLQPVSPSPQTPRLRLSSSGSVSRRRGRRDENMPPDEWDEDEGEEVEEDEEEDEDEEDEDEDEEEEEEEENEEDEEDRDEDQNEL